LELPRPLLAWGFAAGGGSIFGAAAVLDTVREQDQQANQAAETASKTSKKDQHFLAFIDIPVSELTLSSFEAQFWSLLSIPLAWGFAAGSGSIFGAAGVLDTVQEQDQQANQAAGPASNTRKQDQQARPAFSGICMQIYARTL